MSVTPTYPNAAAYISRLQTTGTLLVRAGNQLPVVTDPSWRVALGELLEIRGTIQIAKAELNAKKERWSALGTKAGDAYSQVTAHAAYYLELAELNPTAPILRMGRFSTTVVTRHYESIQELCDGKMKVEEGEAHVQTAGVVDFKTFSYHKEQMLAAVMIEIGGFITLCEEFAEKVEAPFAETARTQVTSLLQLKEQAFQAIIALPNNVELPSDDEGLKAVATTEDPLEEAVLKSCTALLDGLANLIDKARKSSLPQRVEPDEETQERIRVAKAILEAAAPKDSTLVFFESVAAAEAAIV